MTLSFWDFVAFFIIIAIIAPISREWVDDAIWHIDKVLDNICYFFKRKDK